MNSWNITEPDPSERIYEGLDLKAVDCPNCAGTGEGPADGTRCPVCKGKGYYLTTKEQRHDFYTITQCVDQLLFVLLPNHGPPISSYQTL